MHNWDFPHLRLHVRQLHIKLLNLELLQDKLLKEDNELADRGSMDI